MFLNAKSQLDPQAELYSVCAGMIENLELSLLINQPDEPAIGHHLQLI